MPNALIVTGFDSTATYVDLLVV